METPKKYLIYADGAENYMLRSLSSLRREVSYDYICCNSEKISQINSRVTLVNTLDDVPNLESYFVLIALPMESDSQEQKLIEVAELLTRKKLCYAPITLFFSSPYVTSRGLKVLLIPSFTCPYTNNKIDISLSVGRLFKIQFDKTARDSVVRLEKNVYAINDYTLISIAGKKNILSIAQNTTIETSSINLLGNAKITINKNCYLGKDSLLVAGRNFHLIDSNNQVIFDENIIEIDKHVRIGNGSKIFSDTTIESGSVIENFSYVKGVFGSCKLIGGNPAKVLKNEISWALDSDITADSNFYTIKDRAAFQYFSGRKNIVMHGSCVSRIIVSYLQSSRLSLAIFQNPIHTMFFKPLPVAEKDLIIKNDSQYIRSNLFCEFNKLGAQRIVENVGDYILIDLADIRFNYFEINDLAGIRLYSQENVYATLEKLKANGQIEGYVKNYYANITDEEWQLYCNKYAEILKQVYPLDKILLLKVPVAKFYYRDGKKVYFPEDHSELIMEPFLRKIESLMINLLNGCKVIEYAGEVVSDSEHFLGCSPLHYAQSIYFDIAQQIDDYINKGTGKNYDK